MPKENHIDITGHRYNMLTVIEYSHTVNHSPQWRCLCDCGKECLASSNNLRTGHKKSCGHLMTNHSIKLGKERAKHILENGYSNANFGKVYNEYKGRKPRKGTVRYNRPAREWHLTPDQAYNLFTGNCHYCGCKPCRVQSWKKSGTSPGVPDFVYNGIDRKDNLLGYTPENSVSCCTTCNFMKGEIDYDSFVEYVRRIYMNLKPDPNEDLVSNIALRKFPRGDRKNMTQEITDAP